MGVSEHVLEENEAKIDNILHKVLLSVQSIRDLNDQIESEGMKNDKTSESIEYIEERCKKVRILTEIIENLIILADLIDVKDERITKELEDNIKDQLEGAIQNITEAKKLLT